MRTTFILIDKLMEELATFPAELKGEQDIRLAENKLKTIKELDWRLDKLVAAHKNPVHFQKLHNFHLDSIPNWTEHVNAQFKRMDSLMRILYEDIPKLQNILEKVKKEGRTHQNHINSNDWANKVGDMGMAMVMEGLHDSGEELERLRKVEVFEKQHLLDALGDLKYFDHLFKEI